MVLSPLPDTEIFMDHITHQFHHRIGLYHPLPEPNTVPGTWWAFMVFLTISWHRPSWPESCCCCSKSCLTLYDPMDRSMPGFPVLHYLTEFAQIHVHWVGDAIEPFHPLLPSFPVTFQSLPQHQGLFQWVSSSHQVAKILELQLQHQSFQWIFRVDFL